jgi:hypothetical protein
MSLPARPAVVILAALAAAVVVIASGARPATTTATAMTANATKSTTTTTTAPDSPTGDPTGDPTGAGRAVGPAAAATMTSSTTTPSTAATASGWTPAVGAGHVTSAARALEALHATWCAATPARPLVVVQLGDSHTAGGWMTAALQQALAPQQTSAPGYVPPDSPTTRWATSTLRGRWTSASWLRDRGNVSGAQAGPGGQVAEAPTRGSAAAVLRLRPLTSLPATTTTTATETTTTTATTTTTTREAILVLPQGGRVTLLHDPLTPVPSGALRVDDAVTEPIERISTPLLARTTLSVPPGAQEVTLDVTGVRFRFYGWFVFDPTARVEVDTMGVGGVTVMQSARRADASLEEYLAWRRPDLVVVWLGTNDAVAVADEFRRFDEAYRGWLDRLRAAAPQAGLVAVGPPDFNRRPEGCPSPVGRGRRRRGGLSREQVVDVVCRPQTLPAAQGPPVPLKGIRTAADWADWLSSCGHVSVPTLTHVIDVERAAVVERGGVFFDTFAWMGGPLSIRQLACLDPPLASLDLVHLKPEGYALVGHAVGEALTSGAACAPANATTTNTTTNTTTTTSTTAATR